jgi:EAL domain-containing protein (putative c-di-GMP-specific phosphodiesterase class I)
MPPSSARTHAASSSRINSAGGARPCLTFLFGRRLNDDEPARPAPACLTTQRSVQAAGAALRPVFSLSPPLAASGRASRPDAAVGPLMLRAPVDVVAEDDRLAVRVGTLPAEDRRLLRAIDPQLPTLLPEILGLLAERRGQVVVLEHHFEVRLGGRSVRVEGLDEDAAFSEALNHFADVMRLHCVYTDADVKRYQHALETLGPDLAPYAMSGGKAMRLAGLSPHTIIHRPDSILIEWSRERAVPAWGPQEECGPSIRLSQDVRVSNAAALEELPRDAAFWQEAVDQLHGWIVPRLQGIALASEIGSGRFVAFEALAPQLVMQLDDGPLAMRVGRYMRLLEAHDLVAPFDRAMIGSVLGLLRANPDMPPISANVSSALLNDRRFPAWLAHSAERMGVAPSRLRLELTEKGDLPILALARTAISALSQHGFPVVIDDITEGHSTHYADLNGIAGVKLSSYLINLAFLDMDHPSNARRVGLHEDARAKLESIAATARERGWTVVAEGVRTATKFDRLKTLTREQMVAALAALGIDLVQGFGIDRPAGALDRGLLWPQDFARPDRAISVQSSYEP